MKWLHISDLHFGYDSATVNNMRTKLIELISTIGSVDCLFVTGDLRYGKTQQADYPDETISFLQQLQEALGIQSKDTFIVPGNHDVNRDTVLEASIDKALKFYSTTNGEINKETLDYIQIKRAPFHSLYKKLCGRDEPGWHYCIPKNGFNIICLNTALCCCKDGEDGGLIVGSRLIQELSEAVDKSKPGIVLAHHDFDALRIDEQQFLEIALKEMGAVLYLCGHKHVALAHTQDTYQQDQHLRVFLCGTNMDIDPMLEQTDMDVFVGEIDAAGKQGYIQAFKWNKRYSAWMPDIEFSYPQGGAIDSLYYFPPETRPAQSKQINSNVLEQYRQYIRRQCSEVEMNGLPTNAEDITRRYALERIFVPVSFKRENNPESKETAGMITESITTDQERNSEEEEDTDVALTDLIPAKGVFRHFILSDPGGGKTTLLKWIASAFCFPDEYQTEKLHLPRRDIFPVWIRCRDIPKGSRLTIWSIIENISHLGEWMPQDFANGEFINLVAHYIRQGTALLLIDGLDEIGSDGDRLRFVQQLRTFVDSNPNVHVIVTSRIAGFSVVTNNEFRDFNRYTIAQLEIKDIEDLCIKWYQIVYGHQEGSEQKARDLASRITSDAQVLRLSSNPLMLTTLLLVERRVGRLPTKRAALYDEAIQVLLETWNLEGHADEKIDLVEAKYQLAYVAFQMTVDHTPRITRKRLLSLLREVRQKFPDLISSREPITAFLTNIERRSAILVQKGLEQSENGMTEAIYEFQHLTFQEYLAAYAVVEQCYPGIEDGDRPIEVLKPHLADAEMKEMIPLVAAMNRFCAKALIDEILERLSSNELSFDEYSQLRTFLLQFVADEVPLKDDILSQIFSCCFDSVVWNSDIKAIRQILDGRYCDNIRAYADQSDRNTQNGYADWGCIFACLSGQIADPYQYYLDNRNATSNEQKARAISVLSKAFWMDRRSIIEKTNRSQRADLKRALLAFSRDANQYVQSSALQALDSAFFIQSPEDFAKFISASAEYLNKTNSISNIVSIFWLSSTEQSARIESEVFLTDEAFNKLYAEIKDYSITSISEYGNLLTRILLAIICHTEGQQIDQIFPIVQAKRKWMFEHNPLQIDRFHNLDKILFSTLQQSVLLNSSYADDEKSSIQRFILQSESFWAKEKTRIGRPSFNYSDYSLTNETSVIMTSENSSLDKLILYLNSRLDSIGNIE